MEDWVRAPLAADPLDDEVDSFDAARILGVTLVNLRQLQWRGQITPVHMRKRTNFYKRVDIVALAENRHERGIHGYNVD